MKIVELRGHKINVDARDMCKANPEIWSKNARHLITAITNVFEDMCATRAYYDNFTCAEPSPIEAIRFVMEQAEHVGAELFPDAWERHEKHMADERLPRRPSKQPLPGKLRTAVFERDEYRCRRCLSHKQLCCDHVIPESKGGPTTLENLQTLCKTCNSRKRDKLPHEEQGIRDAELHGESSVFQPQDYWHCDASEVF